MAKVLTKIINAICVLIICAALVLLGSVLLSRGQSYPSVMGFSIFRVMSASMEPEIKTDSMILVKKVDPKNVQVGDVITFVSSDPTIEGYANTHRVMAIDNSSGSPLFTTKGDNNVIADKYKVPAADVIGKVIFVSHLIGLFIRLMSNPLCFGAIIIIPLAIIFILNVRDLFKAAKAYEEAELRGQLKSDEAEYAAQIASLHKQELESDSDISPFTENVPLEEIQAEEKPVLKETIIEEPGPSAPTLEELFEEPTAAPSMPGIPKDATIIQGLFVSDIEAALNEKDPELVAEQEPAFDYVAIDFGDGEEEIPDAVPIDFGEPEAPVFEGKTVEEVLRERGIIASDATAIPGLFED